jgi:ribosomal protein L29
MSRWSKAARIYGYAEQRSETTFTFPLRGASAQEIAEYLLENKKHYLTREEQAILAEIQNPT